MKVELINYTENDRAIDILIYTKETRLTQGRQLWDKIAAMSYEEKMAQLDYMAGTIPSSWEMLDYTFQLTDVTRAFTHQFVRTRTGSYAQQTMRMLAKENFTYETGPSIDSSNKVNYDYVMAVIQQHYDNLIENGVAIEDARGILPTNIHTNIVAKFNLRTLAEMARSRTGGRTQGEYQKVMQAMIDEVIKVHPWADKFLNPDVKKWATELEGILQKFVYDSIESPEAHLSLEGKKQLQVQGLKIIDQFKKRL